MPKEHLNSVTSVPIFCQGPSAAKSRLSTFPEVSPTFPLYEPWLVAVGLPADAAPEAHLARHPEHRLVRYAGAFDGAQLHRRLPVADAVGEPAEGLRDPGAQLRPGRRLRVRERVVVRRPGQPGGGQQVGEGVALP